MFIWPKFILTTEGDQLNKMLLQIIISCLLALLLAGISSAADEKSSNDQILYSYEGDLADKDIFPVDLVSFIGAPAFFFAEAVKFNAPKPNWKINAVQLYAWDGFNGTNESVPMERIIGLEIRDKDLKLLYKFADSQLPYSNYAHNATLMYPLTIDIPQVPVSGEFYVCFFDRGAVVVAAEPINETSKTSFIYVEDGNSLINSTLPTGENLVTPVNWIMAVNGN